MIIETVKVNLLVRGSNLKPLKHFPIRIQYTGEKPKLERMTDQQGKVTFELKADQNFDVFVLKPNGSFEKNATINTTRASRKLHTIIGVDHLKNDFVVKLQIKMIDLDKKPVPNHKLEIKLEGETFFKKSDQNGVIKQLMLVGEQILMNCIELENNLSVVETFNKITGLDEYPSRYKYIPHRAGECPIVITLPMHVITTTTEPNKPTTQLPPLTPPSMSCGIEFRKKVSCIGYPKKNPRVYGVLYNGKMPLENYQEWDDLIERKIITNKEKNIMLAVSPNEGNLDAVQSWDSEVITAGAMQKTINIQSKGELPTQMSKFKLEHPELFTQLFLNCGWDVDGTGSSAEASYKGLKKQALKAEIRKNCSAETKGLIVCPPAESLIAAIIHPKYIERQVQDFIDRLNIFLN